MLPKEAFVQDMKIPPRMSKPLLVFFAIFQFLFGYNFGFVKQMNKNKIPAQIISAAMGIIMSVFGSFAILYESAWIDYVAQYFLTFLILRLSPYTVYEFMSGLSMIKIEIDRDFTIKYIGTVTWIYAFLTFWFKFLLGALFTWNKTGQGPFVFRFLMLILISGLDGIPIVNSLVFYHIYVKLKHLCLRFSDKISALEVHATYKIVLDLLDKVRPTTDNLTWTTICCSYAYALHLTVQMCVPAVCAELMQARTDELSLLVHERLLVEKDESTRTKLSQLARYNIHARPPLRKAWRMLPTGLQLPIAMLSMCATQLIVVVTFTHLYD